MISFNIPTYVGNEIEYIKEAIDNHHICGDGPFTMKCNKWLEQHFNAERVMLTTSGSSALDMAAILCNAKDGDEVILPSFTFPSTANAFVMVGMTPVFVDIRPDTMNIDESKIEAAITDKTKVICPVHYAGVSCEMDKIMDIAARYKLKVVEDAAQGVMSSYKGKALGTIGDYGCYSFHETKNFSMGEGGAICINRTENMERAEILREKGTNRSKYYRGQVDKYQWVDLGDSYLPSELNAAFLWAQLQQADLITTNRMESWNAYYDAFTGLSEKGVIDIPVVPEGCKHSAHLFYIKCKDLKTKEEFISYMKENGVACPFHYVPLHSSPAGRKYGRFNGKDEHTTRESERLVRLPLYYGLKEDDREYIISKVLKFFNGK